MPPGAGWQRWGPLHGPFVLVVFLCYSTLTSQAPTTVTMVDPGLCSDQACIRSCAAKLPRAIGEGQCSPGYTFAESTCVCINGMETCYARCSCEAWHVASTCQGLQALIMQLTKAPQAPNAVGPNGVGGGGETYCKANHTCPGVRVLSDDGEDSFLWSYMAILGSIAGALLLCSCSACLVVWWNDRESYLTVGRRRDRHTVEAYIRPCDLHTPDSPNSIFTPPLPIILPPIPPHDPHEPTPTSPWSGYGQSPMGMFLPPNPDLPQRGTRSPSLPLTERPVEMEMGYMDVDTL